MMDSLFTLDASTLAQGIRNRDFTPTDVVEAHIARIEQVNPHINAVVTPLFEQARQQAHAADQQLAQSNPETLPPLFGVPFTVKDMFNVAGVRRTSGSLVYKDYVASDTACAVERIMSAGAILLGKTNAAEMGLAIETDNLVFGLTRNPWNLERSAGGSSGGEAAIISAGGSPLGLGSDSGGSVRIPAGFCGVFGFKPTRGHIPLEGHFPLPPNDPTLHIGPLARSVADIALIMNVVSKKSIDDYQHIELAGRRLIVFEQSGVAPVQSVVKAALTHTSETLQDRGMTIVRDNSVPLREVAMVQGKMVDCNDLLELRTLLGGDRPVQLWREILAHLQGKPRIASRSLLGLTILSVGRVAKVIARSARPLNMLQSVINEQMGDGGLLLCPTFPTPPPEHGFMFGLRYAVPFYTAVFNLLGYPAISVPVGLTPDGLPLSIQIVAQPNEDAVALAVAAAIADAYGPPDIAPTMPDEAIQSQDRELGDKLGARSMPTVLDEIKHRGDAS